MLTDMSHRIDCAIVSLELPDEAATCHVPKENLFEPETTGQVPISAGLPDSVCEDRIYRKISPCYYVCTASRQSETVLTTRGMFMDPTVFVLLHSATKHASYDMQDVLEPH